MTSALRIALNSPEGPHDIADTGSSSHVRKARGRIRALLLSVYGSISPGHCHSQARCVGGLGVTQNSCLGVTRKLLATSDSPL